MRSRKLALLAALALGLAAPAAGAAEAEDGRAESPSASASPSAAEAEAPEASGAEAAPEPEGEASSASAASEAEGETEPPTAAEEAPEAAEPAPAEAAEAAPSAPVEPAAAEPAEEAAPAAAREETALGPVGYDEQGRRGRIHVVVRGDTLWDISDAYLGTPWVWPSVWQENQAIDNPHLIRPGDRIWITAGEMRRVTAEEAERLLANEPPAEESAEPPASFDAMEAQAGSAPEEPPTYHYSEIQTSGFISEEAFQGSFSIVETPEPRRWLGDHDRVVIGRGEGDVEKGDRFDIFRPEEIVYDPDSGDRLGRVTRELGWLEVDKVHPESATAVIRLSRDEIVVGDHLREREAPDPEIAIRERPEVDGRIVHLPGHRISLGDGQVVYLDRGTRHGLERGSPLEVYRPLGSAVDRVRDERVALPDEVVAKLLVVSAREGTSTALVTHARSEVERGDRFRGTDSIAWEEREPR